MLTKAAVNSRYHTLPLQTWDCISLSSLVVIAREGYANIASCPFKFV